MRIGWAAVVALGWVIGCSDDNNGNAPGTEGGPCYPNGTCNTGLTCASNVCVRFQAPDGAAPDGAVSDAPASEGPIQDSVKPDAPTGDAVVGEAAPLDGGEGLVADALPDAMQCQSNTDCDDGLACTTDVCSAGGCVNAIAGGFCVIDGTCRTGGTVNPAVPCQKCDPAKSPTTWYPDACWVSISGAPTRERHTVTLLTDGRVLITGGWTTDPQSAQNTFHSTALVYSPTTGQFAAAGQMSAARADHTATLLQDGRVLVTGGRNAAGYLQSTELYDPQKPAAQAWSAGPGMAQSRWSHSATMLQSGDVLVAGGFHAVDSIATIAVYKPSSNSWVTPAALLTEARRGHTATRLKGGKVLFAGGIQGTGSIWNTTYLDTLEVYDPVVGTMTKSKAVMSKQRAGHTSTLLPTGKVFIVGGVCLNNCKSGALQVDDLYDPAADAITPRAHAGDLPSTHVAVLLKDGRVLVAGDIDAADYANVFAYDPVGALWTTMPSLAVGRWSPGGTLLKDGSVFVVGGVTSASPYTYAKTAERFYP